MEEVVSSNLTRSTKLKTRRPSAGILQAIHNKSRRPTWPASIRPGITESSQNPHRSLASLRSIIVMIRGLMSLRAWFRPPRHWLGVFLLITLAPSILLVWLGWRSLQQDRTLDLQAVKEHREQAADLIVSGLEQSVAAAEQSLRDSSAIEVLAKSEGAVAVVLTPDHIEAYPRDRLLYYPTAPAGHEAPSQVFATADDLEFRRSDYSAAEAALRKLAQSPDRAVRAAALIRLARNLRKAGQHAGALGLYSQAAEIRDVNVSGVPADLLARWARCDLLAQEHRSAELRQEARALYTDLLRGRWQLSRSVYELHVEEARRWSGGEPLRPPADSLAVAAAVKWLWNQRRNPGSRAVTINGKQITMLVVGDDARLTALVATPDYVEREWIGKLYPLLNRQHVRVALRDHDTRPAANETRRAAGETGLPWTVAVESTGVESDLARIGNRRTLWLAGLAVLAALVILGTYVIARAVSRELAVARLQADFVSAVSHEFRTPLTSMRQLTEILSDGRITNETRRQTYYQALSRQTERLHRLVESLLDFGRMEAGTSPYRLEVLDVCGFVRSVVADFEAEAAGRGYHVELNLDGAPGAIAGDRAALTNVLWNLLDNAVKYSPQCRTVWVDVERDGRLLAIRVRDHGLGIPAGEQKEIFRKFVRGGAAKAENIKGTGIGLAMVQHVVRAHRGKVSVSSAPGAGSTFTVALPMEDTCPAS
jgi:signal transduction histidine kinase